MRAALDLAEAAMEIAGGQTPCMQHPDAWFPDKTTDNLDNYLGVHRDSGARELCKTSCEILLQCRAYALKHHETIGIWGGLSYMERKVIWSEQHRAKTSRKGIPNKRR
jgi:hypothetical protein